MEKMVLPLTNGIGVVEKKKLCVSVIDEEGNKRVGGQTLALKDKVWALPVIRAFAYFFYAFSFYFKALFLQEGLKENLLKTKKEKQTVKISQVSTYLLLTAVLITIFLVAFFVVGLLPSFLYNRFLSYNESAFFRSLMISIIRTSFLFVILLVLRFMPFMQSFYSFNGAGNLYITGKGERLREINYPLNFLNLHVNVFGFSCFVISLAGINLSWIANVAINLAIFLISIPLVYEFLKFASEGRWSWLRDLFVATNFLVTIPPKTTHIEVLIVAKREIENYDEFVKADRGQVPMSALYAEMTTKLKAQERYEESDIDWIIATVLKKNRAEIKLCRSVTEKEYREIIRACDRRAKGEPLSSIFGFVDFYGLRFDVNKKVLSPRMDTEVLVEQVIKKAGEIDAKNILDLCTGSGAIAVTLAKYTGCRVAASDISKQALAVAQQNAKNNEVKVDFFHSDLTKGLKKRAKYDIIVSNPPYIKSGEIEKLDNEVKKYDPRLALDGGEDGLDFYRRIAAEVPSKLAKKGWLFLEVGKGQADDVCLLLQENGFDNVASVKDYNKIERVVYGRISK